jgi:hypothetical protein
VRQSLSKPSCLKQLIVESQYPLTLTSYTSQTRHACSKSFYPASLCEPPLLSRSHSTSEFFAQASSHTSFTQVTSAFYFRRALDHASLDTRKPSGPNVEERRNMHPSITDEVRRQGIRMQVGSTCQDLVSSPPQTPVRRSRK